MKIVLDTNVIFGNWFLYGPNFRVMEQLVKLDVCKLVIPEIIMLEVGNKYKEELAKGMPAISHLNVLLPGDKQVSRLNIDELCKNYEDTLTKKLQDLSVEIPSHSDISQDDIISRLFGMRKPFNKAKTSDKGYRDALLWEVILRKVVEKDGATFFITDNVGDFADDKRPNRLHEDLIKDLENRGLPETAVCLCVSLARWVSDHGTQYLEIAEIAEDLKDGECEGFSLRTWFISERETFIEKLNEEIAGILSMWSEIEDPTVIYIEDPESVDVEEALMVDKDTVFLKAEVLADVSIDAFMEKWQYDPETNPVPLMLIDSDWNETYMFVSLFTGLPIRFSAVFDIHTKRITSFEFDDIEFYGWCRYCGAVILSDSAEECNKCGRQF